MFFMIEPRIEHVLAHINFELIYILHENSK